MMMGHHSLQGENASYETSQYRWSPPHSTFRGCSTDLHNQNQSSDMLGRERNTVLNHKRQTGPVFAACCKCILPIRNLFLALGELLLVLHVNMKACCSSWLFWLRPCIAEQVCALFRTGHVTLCIG